MSVTASACSPEVCPPCNQRAQDNLPCRGCRSATELNCRGKSQTNWGGQRRDEGLWSCHGPCRGLPTAPIVGQSRRRRAVSRTSPTATVRWQCDTNQYRRSRAAAQRRNQMPSPQPSGRASAVQPPVGVVARPHGPRHEKHTNMSRRQNVTRTR